MFTNELRTSRRGLAVTATVWFMTNMPSVATFCRISSGSGLSELMAELRKIVQSLRL